MNKPELLCDAAELLPEYNKWLASKKALDTAKNTEMRTRMKLLKKGFGDVNKLLGSKTVKITDAIKISVSFKRYLRTDLPGSMIMAKELSKESFDALIRYKPEIKEGGYKALEGEERKLAMEHIAQSNAAPSIEVKD